MRASSSCFLRCSRLASSLSFLAISPSCSLRAFFSASVILPFCSFSWSCLSCSAAFLKSPLARSLANWSAGPFWPISLSCWSWRLTWSGEPSCFCRSLRASVSLFISTMSLSFWAGGALARSSAFFSIWASSFSASGNLSLSIACRWLAIFLVSASVLLRQGLLVDLRLGLGQYGAGNPGGDEEHRAPPGRRESGRPTTCRGSLVAECRGHVEIGELSHGVGEQGLAGRASRAGRPAGSAPSSAAH